MYEAKPQSTDNAELPTLSRLFFHAVDRHTLPVHVSQVRDGKPVEYSTAQFKAAVLATATFLEAGLKRGDAVAVLAENQPEWHIIDFAIHLLGLVSVPVYPTFSPEQILHVLSHSGAAALVVSSKSLWDKVSPLLPQLPDLRIHIATAYWDGMPQSMHTLRDIIQRYSDAGAAAEPALRAAAASQDPESTATIVYTSGTTGPPKGAVLSHRNITSNLDQGIQRLEFRTVDQALSVLPLAHVFERLLCYGYFRMGVSVAYGDPHQLSDLLRAHRPVVMAAVPRILEKIRELVLEQIDQLPQPRKGIAKSLLRAGLAHGGTGMLNHSPKASQVPAYKLANLLVFSKVRRKLGGRLRYFICGGARLDPAVERFFFAAGFHVIQGYGLTETAPVVSLTPYGAAKPGTVGKPLDAVDVKFDEDGEILVRGSNVMSGYHREPEQTAEAFCDGWFRTGDLGHLDRDGYLVITGRKKEILVTSGGKNVRPAAVEEELHQSPLIARAFVVGDARKYVAALIIPERQKVLRAAGISAFSGDFAELAQNPRVRELIQSEIQERLAQFSEWEKVKQFALVDESLLTDAELMTPTQKLRRRVLEQKYKALIDDIYENHPGAQAAAGGRDS